MKKSKVLALLLSLSLFCTMVLSNITTYADDNGTSSSNSGMEISKTATANDDGTYTITLGAYATGRKIISEETKDIPTDIVLVLDQSGSMGTRDFPSVGTTTYTAYTGNQTQNSNLYSKRHNNNGSNGNLYYPLGDGSYATVSVERTQAPGATTFTECPSNWDNASYYNQSNNLYIKVGDKYEKVTVTRTGSGISGWRWPYTYTFTLPDGGEPIVSTDPNWPINQSGTPNFGDRGPLYYATATVGEYTYTYTCTDAEGTPIDIGTSTGENTNFTDAALYYRTITNGGNITRLQALKDAASNFIEEVSKKALGKDGEYGTQDDVNHRVAVVGFASTKGNRDTYSNTELLSTQSVVNYGSANSGNYTDALVPVNVDGSLNSRLSTAINRLEASGDTYLEYGMDMANNIFEQYPVSEEDASGRQRVVIVFTDGYPAPSGTNNFNYQMADNAIRNAYATKNAYGASVYTVAILKDANPTADIESGFTYGGTSSASQTVASNRYLHYVSSNFPDALNLQNGGNMNDKVDPFNDGVSYYLSATDADTLNNIFQQIANKIENGGSATTLDENAVIKDIISPQFTLPEGTTANDITLETYSYIGENQWSKNDNVMGATATVNGDQVSVTGFDFSENWCGTVTESSSETYRGNKLVISFTVSPKAGFLGGNNVYTNTSAGVYESNSATEPKFIFDRPQVNVPIKDVTVTPEDKNVYLLGSLTGAQLKENAAVDVGGVTLDLTKPTENWGLESWQNEYVNIAVEIKDKASNVIASDLTGLTEDSEYTVSVTVSPKTEGTATEKSGSGKGKINVFKPELTFKDGEVYYGDDVPESYDANKDGTTVWKHSGTASTGVTMIGEEPVLTVTCTPDSTKVVGGKINTKQDVPVDVTVKIGNTDVTDKTSFQHTNCEGKTCIVPSDFELLLHVKTCQLTITKTGGETGEPYVFNVYKAGTQGVYTQVTIVGNGSETIVELPVGTYTIEEDTGWSWRYTANNGGEASLTAQNPKGSITCINTKAENHWLNGFSEVVTNIFGKAATTN